LQEFRIMEIDKIVNLLRNNTDQYMQPLIDIIIEEYGKDPFLVLIGCLLSLRVKDSTTIHVCRELFNRARTPEQLLLISRPELEKIVFKTGFFRNKAYIVHDVSKIIHERFQNKVPDTYEELISIRGVGPKTANLVLGMAFGKPAICVDTHVHRISNRLGLISTKTPEETEDALKKLLPKKYWISWNKYLVIWGQNICAPISPKCSSCVLNKLCKRVGVTKSR